MRSIIFLLVITLSLVSCSSYSTLNQIDNEYPEIYCDTIEYIKTETFMSRSAIQNSLNDFGEIERTKISKTPTEIELTYAALTKFAQEKYGEDVMILNVIWDKKSGDESKRISATFDVVRCK